MYKSESGQRYLCPYCQTLLRPGQIHDCRKDKQIADLQAKLYEEQIEANEYKNLYEIVKAKLDECELALDDMRLGRAIADNKLDIAREELKGVLEIAEDRFYFDAIDRINMILDKLEV